MKKRIIFFLLTIVICIFFINDTDVAAAISNQDILNTVLERYQSIASTWQSPIKAAATRLFWILATISLVWTYSQLLFQKADIAAFFGETVKFIMFTGFFMWLLTNGPIIADSIIESFKKLGGMATGQPGLLKPSGIVDIGFKVVEETWSNLSVTSPLISFSCILVSLGVLIMLAFVAINMLLQLCSAWILAYAGIFFLGFGGSRWTSDMALNYYKSVISVGVSIFTMILITGIGKTIIEQYESKIKSWDNMNELCVLFVVALTLLELVNKVPNMVANVATGGGIGGSGIGSFGGTAAALGAAAAALTGAAKTIKGAVGAGKTAGLAAGSAAGGGLAALKAACNAASQAQQMGTGAFAGIKPSAPDDGSLVRAMHGSPAFCAELGKSLGSSMKSAAKDKMSSMKNSMKEKASNAINNSAGGKLAASINKETAARSEKHMESLQSMSEKQDADAKTQQQAQNYVDLASGNLDLNPGATPSAEAQNYVNFASGKMDLNDSQGEGGSDQTPQNDSNSKSE